jgi:RNA polymerase sigma-70 factor (ECF subfamily)
MASFGGATILSAGNHIACDEPDPSSDIAALTTRMARGDEAAYRTFYDGYFNRLLRYLLVLTAGRQEAAQEALQLTLLRVVRHMKPFASEDVLWSWLTVLARSSVIDETRKRSRYLALLDRFLQGRQIETAASDHDADERLGALLETTLAGMPEDERRLIERKYFDGESVETMAAALNATEKAVESRLVRIRRKLREAILTQLKDEGPTPN